MRPNLTTVTTYHGGFRTARLSFILMKTLNTVFLRRNGFLFSTLLIRVFQSGLFRHHPHNVHAVPLSEPIPQLITAQVPSSMRIPRRLFMKALCWKPMMRPVLSGSYALSALWCACPKASYWNTLKSNTLLEANRCFHVEHVIRPSTLRIKRISGVI
jgi:hypothetical protein